MRCVAFVAFFLSCLNTFNQRYAKLFDGGLREDDAPSEGNRWAWYDVLNGMSNGDRTKWDYYTDMNVVAFLNYLSYVTDKERKLKKAQQGINGINR